MDMLKKQLELSNAGRPYAVLTVTETKGQTAYTVGKKMILLEDGTLYGTVGGGALESEIVREAKKALEAKTSYLKTYHHVPDYEDKGLGCTFSATIFVEVCQMKPRIVVCGGGHIGREVLRLAKYLNFSTALVDIRPEAELTGALSDTDQFYHCTDYEKGILSAPSYAETYYVLGASTHTQDKAALKGALQRKYKYIGMLGSKEKTKTLFGQLVSEGVVETKLQTVHTPVGLDIADFSPEQIAVSIIAEILLVKNHKTLRHRGGKK